MTRDEWIYDGAPVWYWPSPHGPRFAGIVDGEPWDCGGTKVVHLHSMEPAYGEWCKSWRKPPRTTVSAAALYALEPREEPKP